MAVSQASIFCACLLLILQFRTKIFRQKLLFLFLHIELLVWRMRNKEAANLQFIKENRSSTSHSNSAKLSDLQDLVFKQVGELDRRRQSFDSNFERSLVFCHLFRHSVQRRSYENTDSGISGALIPKESAPNPEKSADGRGPTIFWKMA